MQFTGVPAIYFPWRIWNQIQSSIFFFYEIYLFFNKFNLKITKHNYTKVKIITITVIALT